MAMKRKYSGGGRPAKRMRRGATSMRRRRTRRYRRGRRNRTYTRISRQPVPDRTLTKLKYVDFLTIVPPNDGSFAGYSFQSSLYDPQAGAGGHQPMWHDTFATLYTFYRVHGIKYSFRITNQQGNPVEGVVTTKPNTSAYSSSLVTEAERRNCHHTFLLSGYSTARNLKGYVSCAKVLGVSQREYKEDDYTKAGFGSDPIRMAQLSLLYNTPIGASTSNVQIWVKLTYYVEMWQRNLTAGS